LRIDDAGRRDECELLDAMAVLAGKLRRQVAAERQSDQMKAVEPEHVEQLEIMHDVIMQAGERRVVSRLAEARVIGNDHPELVGPGFGKIKPVDRAGAMKKHDRLAAAGGMNDGLYPVDREGLAFKLGHRPPPIIRPPPVARCRSGCAGAGSPPRRTARGSSRSSNAACRRYASPR